jgi:transcriptional regulator with XRE-family HTH domain
VSRIRAKASNNIDVYVGVRLRMRRTLLGMSQSKLGELLGVTFQQIQKYEKGANRISASRLQHTALVLEVSPGYFFEGAPAQAGEPGFAESSPQSYVVDFLASTDGLQLNRAFLRVRDPKVRRRIVDLVVSLASANDEDGDKSPG